MQNSKFLQISSLGSADKANHAISNDIKNPERFLDWDNSPNNPIIQGFQGLFNNSKFAESYDSPESQMQLFDADNMVKGQAGVYRSMQDGLVPFGSDIDGKPLYTFNTIKDDENFDLGKNRLYTTASMMQQLGVFENDEEADTFAKFTTNAGDPSFIGAINGLAAQGGKKEAVNLIMKEFGYPDVDSIENYEDKQRASAVAFSAYNLVENSEKLSPAQQSLSLSTMALMSYKFKDGKTLQDRPVVKNADGSTAFSLSDAFGLAGSGFDVFSMQKNWDQLDAFQRLTYGNGSPSQLASTGKRLGLLGDASMGGSAVPQKPEDLGKLGFTAIPSAGIGAITGNKDALPPNYDVVGAGEKPGQVIAVPKGLSYSTSTINGTPEIRSLNNADGIKKASIGAFKTKQNQLPANSVNPLTGTSFAAGLGQSGALQDPYLSSSLAAVSVYGNTINKEAVGKEIKNAGLQVAADVATGGVFSQAKKGVDALTGGKGSEAVDKALEINDKINPAAPVVNKVLGEGFSAVDKLSGGKNEAQQGRDAVRKLGIKSGLINGEDFTVTLSDGTTADVGTDGGGGRHEFRFADKAIGGSKHKLHSYDVDYTNDLDFTSNMMTSSLMRMIAGGKGTNIDQVAGQLGNAALGKLGYGQDFTEDTFNYVRDNVRGFFFKQGIQTKEDAYALSNQMIAEGRITETDLIAMQQGVNMVFDDNGFDTAQVLMSGRWKGIEVAADISKSPGPNYEAGVIKRPTFTETQEPVEQEEFGLTLNPGTYGGIQNTDIFTKAIIKYKDPWSVRNGNESR